MSLGSLVCSFLLGFDLVCCVSANLLFSAVMPVSACTRSLCTCAFCVFVRITYVVICSSCVELVNIYCTKTSGFSLFSLMELLVWLSCGLVGLFQPSNRKAKHLQLDFFLRRCAAFSTVWKLSIIKSSNLHPSALVWSFAHVYIHLCVYVCVCIYGVCILWVCGRGEVDKVDSWHHFLSSTLTRT